MMKINVSDDETDHNSSIILNYDSMISPMIINAQLSHNDVLYQQLSNHIGMNIRVDNFFDAIDYHNNVFDSIEKGTVTDIVIDSDSDSDSDSDIIIESKKSESESEPEPEPEPLLEL